MDTLSARCHKYERKKEKKEHGTSAQPHDAIKDFVAVEEIFI